MKTIHSICLGVAATLALAACGEQADPQPQPSGEATNGQEGATSSAPSGAPATREEAAFAYSCRGLLSAASAASSVLPADEVPAEISRINMKAVSWWTGEAARRDAAAGLTKEETAEMLGGTVRVMTSRKQLDEALPTIRQCLSEMPS